MNYLEVWKRQVVGQPLEIRRRMSAFPDLCYAENFNCPIFPTLQAPKSLDRWYALECWLKIHYFDRHKELSSLYARWMICVMAAAGQSPVGLEADLEVKISKK